MILVTCSTPLWLLGKRHLITTHSSECDVQLVLLFMEKGCGETYFESRIMRINREKKGSQNKWNGEICFKETFDPVMGLWNSYQAHSGSWVVSSQMSSNDAMTVYGRTRERSWLFPSGGWDVSLASSGIVSLCRQKILAALWEVGCVEVRVSWRKQVLGLTLSSCQLVAVVWFG